jgi:hypothetical protein
MANPDRAIAGEVEECSAAWAALEAVNEALQAVKDDPGPYKALLPYALRRADRYLQAVKRWVEAVEG